MAKSVDGGFLNLDPAVAAVLGNGDKKRKEAALPKAERKSLRRERAKAAERNGKRALYDLPEEIINQVKELAERNETTASQVAKVALSLFLEAVKRGEIDLADYRVIARQNPRYGYMLEPKKEEIG